MEIHLAADQQAIVEGLVASGRFRSVDEAVAEGVRLLASTDTLCQQVRAGMEQAAHGDVVDHDTVFAHLKAMAAAAQSGGL